MANRTCKGLRQQFVAKVLAAPPTDECIEWPHGRDKDGYAVIGRRVTHVVLEAVGYPRPTPKHEVAHSCCNPPCVNPAHIRWATRKENHADQLEHGTRIRGEAHHSSKLTEADVLSIRSDRRSNAELGRLYGVRTDHIGDIRSRRSWAWLT